MRRWGLGGLRGAGWVVLGRERGRERAWEARHAESRNGAQLDVISRVPASSVLIRPSEAIVLAQTLYMENK